MIPTYMYIYSLLPNLYMYIKSSSEYLQGMLDTVKHQLNPQRVQINIS